MFENIARDYVVHGRSLMDRAFWAMCVYRYGRWASRIRIWGLRKVCSKIYGMLRLAVTIVSGVDIQREMEVGDHFHIVHPGGVSLHPRTVFGDNCGVMHGVTTGTNMERPGVPVIGNDVFIGCNASVLGPVRIGDGARIAANSLVINDVPEGGIAIGVPARVMPSLSPKSALPRDKGTAAPDEEKSSTRE